MHKYRVLSLLLLAVTLVVGCTKENLEDCNSALELDFEFSLNTDETNYFGSDINRVRVYLFDQNDVLQVYAVDNGQKLEYSFIENGVVKNIVKNNPDEALNDDYVMRLNIPAGQYKVMSWAGTGKGDETTFFHGHMNDPTTHDFAPDVTLGVTTAKDYRMFMVYRNATEWEQDITPTVPEIHDLFYGAVGTRHPTTDAYDFKIVTVKSDGTTREHIELIRNTNILKITISGTQYLPTPMTPASTTRIDGTPYTLYAQGYNGRYKFDNSIGENGRSIRYIPLFSQVKSDTIVADIKVMKLDWEKRKDPTKMMLYFEDQLKNQYPKGGIEIVNTLLQATDDKGNYIYNNQADLDKIYEHPIEIKLEPNSSGGNGLDLKVTIFVHGWEIVKVVPVS